MPYINLDGKLTEVTQEQYDIYTIGQNRTQPAGTPQTPAEAAAAVAAGGSVTNSNTATTPILTPNTTNTSPNQTLTQLYAQTSTPIPVTPTYTDTPGSLKVYGDATPVSSTVNPQASLSANETVVPASTSTTVDALGNPISSTADPGPAASAVTKSAAPTNYGTSIQTFDDGTTLQTFDDGSVLATATDGAVSSAPATVNAAPLQQIFDDGSVLTTNADGSVSSTNAPASNLGTGTSADSANASAGIQGKITNAQQQQTIAEQRKQINNGDWRVRLRLAPQANYLYKASAPGILQPLAVTDGIIFPYTPQIDTSYRANYETYDLTHSNYRGYFYKNSYVDAISVKAVFTAQDTNDANYLLAVITFLKSVTKMFYGQDAQRGAPPPLVYLSGLGDFQFNEHPCVVSQFQYSLPDNVDYIRAGSPKNNGLNLNNRRDRQSVATNSIFGSINRLAAAFLTKGAITGPEGPPTLGLNRPTYVPTKMDITLTLLPIQSRQQVSQQFSLKSFASGDLIKGGFW